MTLLQLTAMFADDYFNTVPTGKQYKIGYFKDFQGNTIKIENLKMRNSKQKNHNISEFRFHRLDEKVFSSKDLKIWNEISDIAEIKNNENMNKALKISPNPVTDILMIYGFEGVKYEIFSVYGIKLSEGIIQTQIDVKFIEQGVYFIKINNSFHKFIKLK